MRIDVQRGASQEQGAYRRRQSEGHDGHNHQRRGYALELGDQYQKNDEQSKAIGDQGLAVGLRERRGLAPGDQGHAVWKHLVSELKQIIDRGLHRESRLNLDINLDGAPLFSPVELAGHTALVQAHNTRQRHQGAGSSANVEVHQVAGISNFV